MSKSQDDTPYLVCDSHHTARSSGLSTGYPRDTHHTPISRSSYPRDVPHNTFCP